MKHVFLLLFITLVSPATAHAQWEQLPGPYGGYAAQYYVSESGLLAITSQRLYRSTDDGHRWSEVKIGLPQDVMDFQLVYQHGSFWYVQLERSSTGYQRLLYVSSDGGSSFVPLLDSSDEYSMATLGGTMFLARTPLGSVDTRTLFRSVDTGKTWVDVSPPGTRRLSKLKSLAGKLYAIQTREYSDWQLSTSSDGVVWDSLFGYLNPGSSEIAVVLHDYLPFSDGATTGVWISIDSNVTYKLSYPSLVKIDLVGAVAHRTGFPAAGSRPTLDTTIYGFASASGILYCNTLDQIYRYNPVDATWKPVTTNIPRYSVDRIVVFLPIPGSAPPEFLLSFDRWSRWNSGYTNGIYRSVADQDQCSASDTGMMATNTQEIVVFGDTLYAVTAANGHPLYFSTDHGLRWQPVELPFDMHGYDIRGIGRSPKGLLYGNRDTAVLLTATGTLQTGPGMQVIAFLSLGDTVFCRTGGGIFRSSDYGVTWGLLSMPPLKQRGISSTAVQNHRVFAGSDSISYSDDGCVTWRTPSSLPYPNITVHSMAANDKDVYAGVELTDSLVGFGLILRSTDAGVSWTQISPRLNESIGTIVIAENKVFYGSPYAVYGSEKDGSHWVSLTKELPILGSYSMTADSAYLYTATSGYGIFRAALRDLTDYIQSVPRAAPALEVSSLVIKPNPATVLIEFEFADPIDDISITDLRGIRLVQARSRISITGNTARLDVHDLPSGTYFCRVKTTAGIQVGKFVRQ